MLKRANDTEAQEDWESGFPVLTADQRIVGALGGNPFVASVIVTLILLVSFFAPPLLFGFYPLIQEGELSPAEMRDLFVFGLDPYSWAAIVSSLLGGHVFTVLAFSLPRDARDVAALAPLCPGLDAHDLRQGLIDAVKRGLRRSGTFMAAGWVLGLTGMTVTVVGASELLTLSWSEAGYPPRYYFGAAWFLVVVPVITAEFARNISITSHELSYLRQVIRRHVVPDLLRPELLRPVSRYAVRSDLAWIVALTIVSLFFFSGGVDDLVTLPTFLSIATVATIVLVMPLIAAHRAILAAKRRELERVRMAIDALGGDAIGLAVAEGPSAERALALIDLERRIAEAREWPIDPQTLGRFGLYLAIPLISWTGGAVVERLLSAALD